MEKFQTSEHVLKDEDGSKNVCILKNKDGKIERQKVKTKKLSETQQIKEKKQSKRLALFS